MLQPSVVDVRFLWSTLTYEICNRVVEVGNHGLLEVTPYDSHMATFSDRKRWTWFRWVVSNVRNRVRNRVRSIRFYGDMGPLNGTPLGPPNHWFPLQSFYTINGVSAIEEMMEMLSFCKIEHLGSDGDTPSLHHGRFNREVTAKNPAWINFDAP